MVFGFHTRPPHVAQNIIVGLDFDGTISYSFHLRVAYARREWGFNLPINKVIRDTWPMEYGMDKYWQMADAVDNGKINEHQLMPGCREVLTSLHSQGFRFAVVTKRGPIRKANVKTGVVFGKEKPESKFVRLTESYSDVAPMWFIKHHGLPIDYYHATDHDHDLKKKWEVCKKLYARAFLDDDLKILYGLVENPTFAKPFFIRQPWNTDQPTPPSSSGIITVTNWNQFGKWLIDIKQMHEAICYFNRWENAYYNLPRVAAFWKANRVACEKYLEAYKREPVGARA